ncbi:MAG: sigma-70 family RNA polymerase sigma factor [Cyclobacteriaceae bacterium]
MHLHEILTGCLAGKRKCQEELYHRFCDMVMGVCLRYARSQEQAEDIFQEVFLKVFQKIDKVKEPDALPGWIKRIAINTAIDHLKINTQENLETEDSDEQGDQQYEELLDKLSNDEIVKIINQLPDGYRMVFNLYAVDGYSHKEIAEQLGITESTSRSQLTYARRLLKEKLKNLGITRYESVI